MHQSLKKYSKKAGSTPGELIFTGEKKVEKVRISIIDYDSQNLTEREVASIDEILPFKDKDSVTWINIDGLHDVQLMKNIQEAFDIHPMIMEDILSIHQRPKIEDMEGYIFAVLKMISFDSAKAAIESEQVSLIMGPKYVITFQEKVGDVFDIVRERLRKAKGRIRKAGSDHLAYSLIDAVVDNYFVVLERVSETVELMEEEVVSNPTPATMHELHKLRTNMVFLRKSVLPLREMTGSLLRGDSKLITKPTMVYLKDLYDHTIQVTDTIETYRDMLSGLMDVYLSSISNRMNEVMKVLTIFAAIFIPLTFIVGVYGMNFEYMPELKWKFGYPMTWGILLAVAGCMLIYFRKKKWL